MRPDVQDAFLEIIAELVKEIWPLIVLRNDAAKLYATGALHVRDGFGGESVVIFHRGQVTYVCKLPQGPPRPVNLLVTERETKSRKKLFAFF